MIEELIKENSIQIDELSKKIEQIQKDNDKRFEKLEKQLKDFNKAFCIRSKELSKEIKDIKKEIGRIFDLIRESHYNEVLNDLKEVELNEKLINDEENNCPICLENYSMDNKVICLPCSHYFHSSCIKNWIRIKNECPYCKNPI